MMKSTKFLAILAGTAMFAACTQEELFEANNTPQQMDEVVGANLVGTDLLMNAYINGSSAQSRYAGGVNAWENNDVVGLGWLVSGMFSDPQTTTSTPASALYANHMFNTENNGATWASKGNLYQGWYFAYHPWSYESAAGKRKGYEMNPAMAGKGAAIHKSQTLYLSNRQFIAADDVNKGNTLSKSFKLYQAVKFIQVTTEAKKGTQFVKGGSLANLPIDSISINVGHGNNIFADRILINAGNLPVEAGYPENPSQAEIDSVEALNLANFQSQYRYVVDVEDAAKDSIVGRNVKAIGLKVSSNPAEDNSYVRMYLNVLPAVANLNIDDVTVTLHSGAASFVIDNKEGQSAANVEALQSLVNAYKADSTLSNINVVTKAGDPSTLRMNLELRPEDFVTDFNHITNIDEWNQAVELVENLGRTSETFKIDSTIVFTNSIRMPKDCQLKVERATTIDDNRFVESLVLGSGTFNEWPANLTSNVYLTIAEDATLKNAHTIKNQLAIINDGTIEVPAGTKDNVNKIGHGVSYTLTNNGTIKLGKYAKAQRVNNTKGTIEVTYGAYVNIRDNKESEKGKIIYVVTPEDVNKPSRIQKVINVGGVKGQVDYASVNVLRFDAANKLTDFDFTLTSAGTDADDDPYIPTGGSNPTTSTFDGLENVSLEINGVNVKSSQEQVCVKNVTINNATLGAGISVDGELTVEGGNVNVTTEHISGKLTIKAGQGTITSETIGSVEILNGNYTVNATTIEGDVTATGENYFNVETIKGKVVLTNTNSNASVNIDGTTFEQDVELNGNFGLVNVNVKGNLTVKGSVKSHNAKVNGSLTVIGGNYANTADEFTTFGNIEVKNGAEFTTSSDIYTEIIKVYGKVTVAEGKTIWYTVPLNAGGYIQEGTTTGKVLNKSNTALVEELKAAIAEGGNVTLKADVVLPEALVITKDITIDLNGKTITAGLFTENGGTMSEGNTDSYGFWVKNGGKLTINGNGTVKTQACKYSMAVWAEGGEVIINGGYYENAGEGSDLIYAKNGGKVIINNGEFKACEHQPGVDGTKELYSALNLSDNSGSQIIVYGGRFYKFNPSDNLSENPKVNFVAAGKTVTTDGDWFVVE